MTERALISQQRWSSPVARAVEAMKEAERRRASTLAAYAEQWFAGQVTTRGEGLRPSTVAGYRNALDVHVSPAFGTLPLDEINSPRSRARRRGDGDETGDVPIRVRPDTQRRAADLPAHDSLGVPHCDRRDPASGRRLLQQVMSKTGTTQSRLSRLSGVHQPSISQFVSGRTELSDDKLGRLLECMGYRLEVVRRPVSPDLTRSERRSWRLHQQLSTHLTPDTLMEWRPHVESRLDHLREQVTGRPHTRNLDRWQRLIPDEDMPGGGHAF